METPYPEYVRIRNEDRFACNAKHLTNGSGWIRKMVQDAKFTHEIEGTVLISQFVSISVCQFAARKAFFITLVTVRDLLSSTMDNFA